MTLSDKIVMIALLAIVAGLLAAIPVAVWRDRRGQEGEPPAVPVVTDGQLRFGGVDDAGAVPVVTGPATEPFTLGDHVLDGGPHGAHVHGARATEELRPAPCPWCPIGGPDWATSAHCTCTEPCEAWCHPVKTRRGA